MIKTITFNECMRLWSKLWESDSSPITPVSAMRLPSKEDLAERPNVKFFSKDVDTPVFLGIYDGKQLIAVNSFHRIGGQSRTRGLYVEPKYRRQGFATKLLQETWHKATVLPVWSYVEVDVVPVYLKAGFRQASEPIFDAIEQKVYYYVVR